jgi:hypothetical protein
MTNDLPRETNRADEIKELTSKGIIPVKKDLEEHPENLMESIVWPAGRVAAQIHDVLLAKEIVDNMMNDASDILIRNAALVNNHKAKL